MVEGLNANLGDALRDAKGFVFHADGPVPGGWRVTEVWESRSDFESWFEGSVKPAFPESGPLPSITFDELNAQYAASG
jgi:hypothetical protein